MLAKIDAAFSSDQNSLDARPRSSFDDEELESDYVAALVIELIVENYGSCSDFINGSTEEIY